ncbi:hypothetical protein C7293_09075 [filamentous cyanobacterium CCT1]|nr:hypothetical protein C7293_09075 [filamentous cyanobacterium CCT1]PSN81076.1 hypothetical protein C8B47_03225 [filamentous cyanobacterium CCP4]
MSIRSPGLAPYRQEIHSGLKQLSRYICLVVILIAVGVLMGWGLAIPWLKSGLPGLPAMRPNTALGFLLAGAALWLEVDVRSSERRYAWQTSLSLGLALACFGLGSINLLEFLLGWDTGLGHWLFPWWAEQLNSVSRGRLAPNTALSFVLFGGSIWLLYRRRYRGAQVMALGMFYVALVGFLGYLYDVETLYGLGSYSTMSLPTSGAFLLLAAAVLLRYPNRGMVAILTADHAGGALVRRLVLAVGLVPVMLCGLILIGKRQGLYSSDFGVVLLCVLVVLLLSLVTWWSGLLLEQSDYYVSFDTLTGLPNRRRFEQQLSQWMVYCRQQHQLLCVLFLDIDRFKYVNDVLGHDLGDELLIHVSRRLQSLMPEKGLLARWGGDEFILLLPKIEDLAAGVALAEAILTSLMLPFQLQNHYLNISVSLGVAIFPEDGEDLRALLQKADLALFEAKGQGRNTYQIYSQVFSERVSEALQLENALVKALEREEFSLHYQPKISLATGQLTGLEALLRWDSPELGRVSPGRIIPVAEETGLIVNIGAWVLREACRQAKVWQSEGLLSVPIAVNISVLQLHQANLLAQLKQLLNEFELSPSLLELEITETAAMQDVDYAQARLHQLSDLGIGLSLDDFGTGFSSLAYLSRFPLKVLKIDRAFITSITTSATAQAIARSIIELGHGLGMRVLAEGVETKQQLAYLRSVGCDEVQGYIFYRPMPAAQVAEVLPKVSKPQ